MAKTKKKKRVIKVEDPFNTLSLPERKTDGAAGYDVHPIEVTLVSYSGLYRKCKDADDIRQACRDLKTYDKRSWKQRIIDFINDEQPNKGWKSLKFNTGLKFAPEDLELYISLEPCSRTAKTDYVLHNSLGTIDNDYRGYCYAIYHAVCQTYDPESIIRLMETCCQLKPKVAIEAEFVKTERLTETSRGEGGFGSTSQLLQCSH